MLYVDYSNLEHLHYQRSLCVLLKETPRKATKTTAREVVHVTITPFAHRRPNDVRSKMAEMTTKATACVSDTDTEDESKTAKKYNRREEKNA